MDVTPVFLTLVLTVIAVTKLLRYVKVEDRVIDISILKDFQQQGKGK